MDPHRGIRYNGSPQKDSLLWFPTEGFFVLYTHRGILCFGSPQMDSLYMDLHRRILRYVKLRAALEKPLVKLRCSPRMHRNIVFLIHFLSPANVHWLSLECIEKVPVRVAGGLGFQVPASLQHEFGLYKTHKHTHTHRTTPLLSG